MVLLLVVDDLGVVAVVAALVVVAVAVEWTTFELELDGFLLFLLTWFKVLFVDVVVVVVVVVTGAEVSTLVLASTCDVFFFKSSSLSSA